MYTTHLYSFYSSIKHIYSLMNLMKIVDIVDSFIAASATHAIFPSISSSLLYFLSNMLDFSHYFFCLT